MTPVVVSKVAMCISIDARGRSACLVRPPSVGEIEVLEQALVESEALTMQGDEAEAGPLILTPRVNHEAVGEGGVLTFRPTEGSSELLLAEGNRVIRYHRLSRWVRQDWSV